jgi:hypothetical protein
MKSIHVSFGGSSVEIVHEGELAAQALDFLFGDLPVVAGRESHLTFCLEPGESGEGLRLELTDT